MDKGTPKIYILINTIYFKNMGTYTRNLGCYATKELAWTTWLDFKSKCTSANSKLPSMVMQIVEVNYNQNCDASQF